MLRGVKNIQIIDSYVNFFVRRDSAGVFVRISLEEVVKGGSEGQKTREIRGDRQVLRRSPSRRPKSLTLS